MKWELKPSRGSGFAAVDWIFRELESSRPTIFIRWPAVVPCWLMSHQWETGWTFRMRTFCASDELTTCDVYVDCLQWSIGFQNLGQTIEMTSSLWPLPTMLTRTKTVYFETYSTVVGSSGRHLRYESRQSWPLYLRRQASLNIQSNRLFTNA